MTIIEATKPISKYFRYKEALWLPAYGRLAIESDGLTEDIIATLGVFFAKMDTVRDYFGRPINVHVAYRPPAYNKLIKGAPDSAHQCLIPGVAACDFDVEGMTCDDARSTILAANKLEEWGMRMEDNPAGSPWIHLDNKLPIPGGARYFVP